MSSELNFLVSQLSHIKPKVYAKEYSFIQYPDLIPVDTSPNPWAQTITSFSSDTAGMADFVGSQAEDFPTTSYNMQQHQSVVHMAGIGMEWSLQELANARMLKIDLKADRGNTARRVYEEFLDAALIQGTKPDGTNIKDMHGLINHPAAARSDVAANPNGDNEWKDKSVDEIMADVNDAITGSFVDTRSRRVADTILLPHAQFAMLANKRIETTETTLYKYIQENSVLNLQHGKKLTIREVYGLEKAGKSGTARMVVYAKDSEVLDFALPMALQFLAPQQHMTTFRVPGIFRFGGVDIHLPKMVRYVDGI